MLASAISGLGKVAKPTALLRAQGHRFSRGTTDLDVIENGAHTIRSRSENAISVQHRNYNRTIGTETGTARIAPCINCNRIEQKSGRTNCLANFKFSYADAERDSIMLSHSPQHKKLVSCSLQLPGGVSEKATHQHGLQALPTRLRPWQLAPIHNTTSPRN